MLEGKTVNLRVMEKEDIPLYLEWLNSPEFKGEYQLPTQWSRTELEKVFEASPFEPKVFIVEKKDGSKIGLIAQYNPYLGLGKLLEIGYALLPSERGKGYCTEATQPMMDYLFLSMDISRVQATISMRNKASERVLEKTGFSREGTIRKTARGAGEMPISTVFSEKNGKNQKYYQNQLEIGTKLHPDQPIQP